MTENTNGGDVELGESALVNSVPRKLLPAEIGRSYRAKLTATGGKAPYSWTVHDGELLEGFAVQDDHIVCERVSTAEGSKFSVRVTDAEGNHADAETSIAMHDPQVTIVAVRRRGVFLFDAVLFALAAAGLLLVLRVCFDLEAFFVNEASRLRSAIGLTAPIGRPDWYIITAMGLAPGFGIVVLVAGFIWYRRVWSRKLRQVWGQSAAARKLARIQPIPEHCPVMRSCTHCELKIRYLRELLKSDIWSDRWPKLKKAAKVEDQLASTLSLDQYRAVSGSVFGWLEGEIVERAIATGLLVGVGRSRWFDSLTIAASSLEMQMFVLSTLGKRPGLRLWLRMLHRCSASLFVNAYLSREDVFALNLLIKKTAWGLHTAAASAQWASEHAASMIDHHADTAHEHAIALMDHSQPFDHHFDSSDIDADEVHHALGGVTKLVSEGLLFSLSVGSVALNQIAAFVEHWSNALLQGAIAGGILYWHGCDLAAEVLAIDREHRRSAAFERTVSDCARRMAKEAGEILKVATRQLRSMYRERRISVLKKVANKGTIESLVNKVAGWMGGD